MHAFWPLSQEFRKWATILERDGCVTNELCNCDNHRRRRVRYRIHKLPNGSQQVSHLSTLQLVETNALQILTFPENIYYSSKNPAEPLGAKLLYHFFLVCEKWNEDFDFIIEQVNGQCQEDRASRCVCRVKTASLDDTYKVSLSAIVSGSLNIQWKKTSAWRWKSCFRALIATHSSSVGQLLRKIKCNFHLIKGSQNVTSVGNLQRGNCIQKAKSQQNVQALQLTTVWLFANKQDTQTVRKLLNSSDPSFAGQLRS